MASDPNTERYPDDNSMSTSSSKTSTGLQLSPASPRPREASPSTSPVLNEMFARSAQNQSGKLSPRSGQLSGGHLDCDILSRMVTASGGASGVPFRVAASMQDFRQSTSALNTVPESSVHTLRARQPNQTFAQGGYRCSTAAAVPRPMSENPPLKMTEHRTAVRNSSAAAGPSMTTASPSPLLPALSGDNKAALQAFINKWAGASSSSSSATDGVAKSASNGRTVASPRLADNESPMENRLLKTMEHRTAMVDVKTGQQLPTIAASPSPPLPQMSDDIRVALQVSIYRWADVRSSPSTHKDEQKKIQIQNSFKSGLIPPTNASPHSTDSGSPVGRMPLSPHHTEPAHELTASQNIEKDKPRSREEVLQHLLRRRSGGITHNPVYDVQRANGLDQDHMHNFSRAHQSHTSRGCPTLNRFAVLPAKADGLRKENQSIQLMREWIVREQRMKEQKVYLQRKAVAASALVSLQNGGGQSQAQHGKLRQMQANTLSKTKGLSSSSELSSLSVDTKTNESSSTLRKRRSVRMDDDESTCSQGSYSTNAHSMTSASSSNKAHRSLSHCSARAALSGRMENLRVQQSRMNALGSGNRNESFSLGLNAMGRGSLSSSRPYVSNRSFSTTLRKSSKASTLKRSSSSDGWIRSLLSEQGSAGDAASTFQIVKNRNSSPKSLLSEQKSAGDATKTFQLAKNSSNSLVSLSHDQPSLSMKEPQGVSNEPIQVRAEEYDPPVIERRPSSTNCEKVIISAVPDRIKYLNAKADIKPIDIVKEALSSRGAKSETKPSADMEDGFFVKVAEMYDHEIIDAIRSNDVDALKRLHAAGTNLQRGNRFGETSIHLACRRGRFDLVSFLVEEVGVSLRVRDDFGRTPLHDACWRTRPDLELLDMLLDRAPELLMLSDKRGHTPLDYARREHWAFLVPFLRERAEKFRPVC